jgi:dienelactone hydrolase
LRDSCSGNIGQDGALMRIFEARQFVIAAMFLTMASSCFAGSIVDISDPNEARKSLPAYLARPNGAGPFPAIVVLHGCGGFGSVVVSWADQLARWGYVALAVDSLTSRGRTSACSSGTSDQVHDAYRALNFLADQSFVRPERVGLVGISLGAGAALAAFEADGIQKAHKGKFRAVVAFYPPCAGSSGVMSGPTLVLVGERDDWTPANDCRDMAAGRSGIGTSRQQGDRSMVDLVVYPDTHHSFLDPSIPMGTRHLGHWLQYNGTAVQDAMRRVRRFFNHWLGE